MGVSRKGYIHALEGIIAAIIVVVYLNSIVSLPSTTQWETTRISKQSEDLLSALDRSGFLDRTVLRGDAASFNALVSSLESSLSYSIQVSGLPRQFVDVGVMVNNSSTFRVDTAPGDWGGSGIPSSEGGVHRQGDLADHPEFGSVQFVLSDTVENDIQEFDAVNFDFNGDGDFGGPGEGPFNLSNRFTCAGGVTGCDGHIYEPGPFNASLVLYNASIAESLHDRKSEMEIGMRTVSFNYGSVNVFDESVEKFDALWVDGWSAEHMEDRDETFQDFLRDGRMLLLHSAVEKDDIDGNYLSDIGFDHVTEYEVEGSMTHNIFFSLHGPKNESYRSSQYYLDSGIRQDDFIDSGGFDEATLELRGSTITVRRWPGDTVAFSSESFSVNYSAGASVTLVGNAYQVDDVSPLVLDPVGEQRFDAFDTERIDADYHLTRMEGRTYNITRYDTSAKFSTRFQNRSDLPPDFDQGAVNTPCDWRDHPYKLGDIDIDGTTYDFLLVNFEPETPCDRYFEFVYFDLAEDDDFDDNNPDGSSREGPYQKGDTVNVSSKLYTVSPHIDGNGTDLKRQGLRMVGEIPVSRNVFGRGGSAALVRRDGLGNDDMHLLASLIAHETEAKQQFTPPRTLGETSLGYSYTSSAGRRNSFGYTLQTVWWLQ